MITANPSCLRLFVQAMRFAVSFAFASAGNSIPARMAMMAMTTSSSINVNAPRFAFDRRACWFVGRLIALSTARQRCVTTGRAELDWSGRG